MRADYNSGSGFRQQIESEASVLIPTTAIYLTTDEFAEMMKVCKTSVQRRCRSKPWRINKIAKKDGGEWRIDLNRFQMFWRGELGK